MTVHPARATYWAEGLGTFALVFAGTGAIAINDITGGQVTHVGVGLTFGLVIMCMIYALGEVSGAHFNPAVTLGFWWAGRLEAGRIAPYIAAQCAGALAGSVAVRFVVGSGTTLGATIPSVSIAQAILLETILTFFLMFVILSVSTGAKEKGITAGIAIGGTVALAALFAGPLCGASMNPARSLGPALVSGHLAGLWIYLAGPLLGAALAARVCPVVHGAECCP